MAPPYLRITGTYKPKDVFRLYSWKTDVDEEGRQTERRSERKTRDERREMRVRRKVITRIERVPTKYRAPLARMLHTHTWWILVCYFFFFLSVIRIGLKKKSKEKPDAQMIHKIATSKLDIEVSTIDV